MNIIHFSCGKALLVRYEDMRQNLCREQERLVDHLNIDVSQEVLRSITKQYEIKNGLTESLLHPLHFNKGITGRWGKEFIVSQREISQELFIEILLEMGDKV